MSSILKHNEFYSKSQHGLFYIMTRFILYHHAI